MKTKIMLAIVFAVCLSWTAVHSADYRGPLLKMADEACAEQKYTVAASYYRFLLKIKSHNPVWAPYVKYRLGRVQLVQGKSAAARANMEDFYRLKPDNPWVVKDYALALFSTKKYREAVPVFEKAAALDKKFEPKARYYIGASKIALGNISEGTKELKRIQVIAPGSAAAKNADELLANLEKLQQEISGMEKQAAVTAVPGKQTKKKPWAVSFSLGMEYDSNVSLIPSEQTRPKDISSTGDWRAVHSLSGVYEFVNTGEHFVGVNAGLYGTNQLQDNMFNVESGLMSLYYKRNMADAVQFRISPFISKTWLATASHNWSWGVTPGISYQPFRWTWTDLNYTYTKVDFIDAPQYSEENRSGKNHNVNLRQNFSFPSLLIAKRNTFFAGWLNYAKSDTDGSSYANHAEGFGILGQQEFPLDFTFLVSYGYTKTNYENANIRSATNEKRDDKSHIVAVNVFKKLDMILKNLSAYMGYRWFKNDSNIDNYYNYTSNTYSAGLTLDF